MVPGPSRPWVPCSAHFHRGRPGPQPEPWSQPMMHKRLSAWGRRPAGLCDAVGGGGYRIKVLHAAGLYGAPAHGSTRWGEGRSSGRMGATRGAGVELSTRQVEQARQARREGRTEKRVTDQGWGPGISNSAAGRRDLSQPRWAAGRGWAGTVSPGEPGEASRPASSWRGCLGPCRPGQGKATAPGRPLWKGGFRRGPGRRLPLARSQVLVAGPSGDVSLTKPVTSTRTTVCTGGTGLSAPQEASVLSVGSVGHPGGTGFLRESIREDECRGEDRGGGTGGGKQVGPQAIPGGLPGRGWSKRVSAASGTEQV